MAHTIPAELILSDDRINLQTYCGCGPFNTIHQSIPDAGWHLTYFLSVEDIQQKLESFSHQEYNKPWIKNRDHIIEVLRNGTELLGRHHIWREQVDPFWPENITSLLPLPIQEFHRSVVQQQGNILPYFLEERRQAT